MEVVYEGQDVSFCMKLGDGLKKKNISAGYSTCRSV